MHLDGLKLDIHYKRIELGRGAGLRAETKHTYQLISVLFCMGTKIGNLSLLIIQEPPHEMGEWDIGRIMRSDTVGSRNRNQLILITTLLLLLLPVSFANGLLSMPPKRWSIDLLKTRVRKEKRKWMSDLRYKRSPVAKLASHLNETL